MGRLIWGLVIELKEDLPKYAFGGGVYCACWFVEEEE